MMGRYGIDSLWKALLVFYIIALLITNVLYRFSKIAYGAFYALSLAILIFAIFRVFSKNIEARRSENESWLRFTGGIKQKFNFQKNKWKQRKTHKFVKCKGCKKTLRLPKHRGKINVTCPHCKNQFVVNTGKKAVSQNK
jgi:phage FluMu protein Com